MPERAHSSGGPSLQQPLKTREGSDVIQAGWDGELC